MPRLWVFAVLSLLAGACAATPGASAPPAAPGDPWAVRTEPDEPPSYSMTRALADRACPRVTAPYFYRLEKAGKVSHILGTRHLGVSLDKLPERVRQVARAATLAVFEVDPADEDQPEPRNEPPISVQLGPELWARYRALVGRANADKVERGSVSTAAVVLVALYEHKFAALDHELQQLVGQAKIPTKGLESARFQSRLLDELLDLRMLRATVAGTPDRATLERESQADLREWCAGTDEEPGMDAPARAQLRAGGYTEAEIDRMDQRLVYDRNTDWIPKLEDIMASGGAFIAVGSDHLTGKRGVIALLEARGWKAERLGP